MSFSTADRLKICRDPKAISWAGHGAHFICFLLLRDPQPFLSDVQQLEIQPTYVFSTFNRNEDILCYIKSICFHTNKICVCKYIHTDK